MQETGLRNLAISIVAASIYSAVTRKVQADHRKPTPLHRLYSPFKLVHGASRTNEQGVSFTFRGLIQPRVSEDYRSMRDIALCCRAARIPCAP